MCNQCEEEGKNEVGHVPVMSLGSELEMEFERRKSGKPGGVTTFISAFQACKAVQKELGRAEFRASN